MRSDNWMNEKKNYPLACIVALFLLIIVGGGCWTFSKFLCGLISHIADYEPSENALEAMVLGSLLVFIGIMSQFYERDGDDNKRIGNVLYLLGLIVLLISFFGSLLYGLFFY